MSNLVIFELANEVAKHNGTNVCHLPRLTVLTYAMLSACKHLDDAADLYRKTAGKRGGPEYHRYAKYVKELRRLRQPYIMPI